MDICRCHLCNSSNTKMKNNVPGIDFVGAHEYIDKITFTLRHLSRVCTDYNNSIMANVRRNDKVWRKPAIVSTLSPRINL